MDYCANRTAHINHVTTEYYQNDQASSHTRAELLRILSGNQPELLRTSNDKPIEWLFEPADIIVACTQKVVGSEPNSLIEAYEATERDKYMKSYDEEIAMLLEKVTLEYLPRNF